MLRFIMMGCGIATLGACSTSHVPSGYADAVEYCEDREAAVCERDAYVGRITIEQFETICVPSIQSRCAPVSWGACTPTQEALRACVAALLDEDRYAVPDRELPECMVTTLCP